MGPILGLGPEGKCGLIIVIWNALVLHARWDKMVKDRGLAVLSIGGIIAVAWSGFGVNQLGAGLHSYGFTSGVALWVAVTVAVSLGLITLGSLPKRYSAQFARASAGSDCVDAARRSGIRENSVRQRAATEFS